MITTSVRYDGPALKRDAEYSYWVEVGDEYGNSSFNMESFVYHTVGTGSISGNISYTGAQTGKTVVAAFTSPDFQHDPTAIIELDSPGAYTISGLIDATYYVVSVLSNPVQGDDQGEYDVQKTDPWGVYGTWGNLTPVTITGGNGISGINITLVDGTEDHPNPFYEEEELYSAESKSHNWQYGKHYFVDFEVGDSDHKAASVEVTGPGITGSLMLDYDNNEKRWNSWYKSKSLDLGSSPPTPPLTYTFTIVDPDSTTVKTDVVESFVSVYATNLSPSKGDTITGSLIFSWRGVGLGYTYSVELHDAQGNQVWDSDDLRTTSVRYDGPALIRDAEYSYWVKVQDAYGNSSYADQSFVYHASGTGITLHPSVFSLSQNFPNPFNPVTTIEFSVPRSEFVTLRVFNTLGEEVARLVDGKVTSGSHTIAWNASGFASGLYFYRLEAGSKILTKKLLLLK
ncbi:MAG: T9SS type A sorting domain-containing protein [Candidatus Latescibacter sp.]|nr:T9SS type A sorting domain-containing protein [Candidatus Latescibacter sp.]